VRSYGAGARCWSSGFQSSHRRPHRAFSRSTRRCLSACTLVKEWLENADTERRMMALEALQVAVIATREQAEVTGVLPIEPLPFITEEQSCRSYDAGATGQRVT
jgi:hypothetical protein